MNTKCLTARHKHERNEKREFHFEKSNMLAEDDNYDQLSIKEIFHIEMKQNEMNDKKDIKSITQTHYD